MKAFKTGDLVSTTTFKGKTIYGIVINSDKKFQYEELRILIESRVKSVIYDGRKGTVRLIQRCKDDPTKV